MHVVHGTPLVKPFIGFFLHLKCGQKSLTWSARHVASASLSSLTGPCFLCCGHLDLCPNHPPYPSLHLYQPTSGPLNMHLACMGISVLGSLLPFWLTPTYLLDTSLKGHALRKIFPEYLPWTKLSPEITLMILFFFFWNTCHHCTFPVIYVKFYVMPFLHESRACLSCPDLWCCQHMAPCLAHRRGWSREWIWLEHLWLGLWFKCRVELE